MTNSNISRRGFLRGGIAATATSTLLAGCLGMSGSNNGSNGGSEDPYSVSIKPMGEVTVDGVPETWLANNGSWADMGIALGQKPPEGVWLTDRYHTQYYDAIPEVSVDKSGMTQLYSDGISKEVFYQIEADVHVMDPNFILNRFKGMNQNDVNQIDQNIAPFFGNTIFSRGYKWHDYRYYTLYEAFEKLSKVFKQEQRYKEFKTLHEEFQKTIESSLPPESERPNVGIFWAGGNEPTEFSPYVMDEGTSFKQWRDLGVNDALAESDIGNLHSSRTHVDLETILKVDPDVLLFRGHEGQTESEFNETLVSFLKEHPVASKLTAVKNDMVFRGGPLYQGPITNLVVTERAAKQVYPDAFGDVTLFDPEAVAGIVNGN
ncbi:ABC transporter substrate-binding protein [Halocatena salina]|uniref:ABC transporter substrate-binding protein n=1 Tax=Halocatena salina TaxID=2934340 RepID=A0A8U0A155_9EURY|nr:ABC transporter substrate-binding protein [Halocatena salina]UPM41717.1 ABC transporter substrate-binding protein [Halocatena salina]